MSTKYETVTRLLLGRELQALVQLRKFRQALAKGSVGFTVLGYAVLCPSIDGALPVVPFLVHTFRATWHLQTMVHRHNKTPKKRSLTFRAYRSL